MKDNWFELIRYVNVLILAVIALLFFSCQDDCIHFKGYDCDGCPEIKATTDTVEQIPIDTVKLYLETSGSMRGFWHSTSDQTKFQIEVPKFIDRVKHERTSIGFVNARNGSFTKDEIEDFNKRIINTQINTISTTVLSDMLESIIGSLGKNSLSIFITDGINDAEEPEEAIDHISRNFENIFKDRQDESVLALFSLYSDFKAKIKGETIDPLASPYYIFIFGKQAHMEDICKEVRRTFRNHNQVNFGFEYPTVNYTILPFTDHTGNNAAIWCDPYYTGVSEIDLSDNPVEFWVGLDLSHLPDYLQDSTFIVDNMILKSDPHTNAQIKSLMTRSSFNAGRDDNILADDFTHFLRVSVSSLEMIETDLLKFELYEQLPRWIDEQSHDNVGMMYKDRGHTYGFDKIIEGIKVAYTNNDSKENLLDGVQIIITKK